MSIDPSFPYSSWKTVDSFLAASEPSPVAAHDVDDSSSEPRDTLLAWHTLPDDYLDHLRA